MRRSFGPSGMSVGCAEYRRWQILFSLSLADVKGRAVKLAALKLLSTEMPGANTDILSRFPEQLRPALLLIQKTPSNDVTVALVQYVASFVHPDFVCNLAMMDSLPKEAKEASLAFFEFCLRSGLSIEDQGALLAFIQPYIVTTLRGPLPH